MGARLDNFLKMMEAGTVSVGRGATLGMTDFPAAAASWAMSNLAGIPTTYGQTLEGVRGQNVQRREEFPMTTAAGEIVGQVANPIGRVVGAAKAVPTVVKNVLAPATTIPGAAVKGAAAGGTLAYNERGELVDAATGAVVGGAAGTLGALAGKGVEKAREVVARKTLESSKRAQVRVMDNRIDELEAQREALVARNEANNALRAKGLGKGLPSEKELTSQIEQINYSINSANSSAKAAKTDLKDLMAGRVSPAEVNAMAGNLFTGNLTKTALEELAQNIPRLGWTTALGQLGGPLARIKLGAETMHIPPQLIPEVGAAAGKTIYTVLPQELNEQERQRTKLGAPKLTADQIIEQYGVPVQGNVPSSVEAPAASVAAPAPPPQARAMTADEIIEKYGKRVGD